MFKNLRSGEVTSDQRLEKDITAIIHAGGHVHELSAVIYFWSEGAWHHVYS
jgi:hypothetical protein